MLTEREDVDIEIISTSNQTYIAVVARLACSSKLDDIVQPWLTAGFDVGS
jgi:hypothetical protein